MKRILVITILTILLASTAYAQSWVAGSSGSIYNPNVTTGSKVGIGTSNPLTLLHIHTPTTATVPSTEPAILRLQSTVDGGWGESRVEFCSDPQTSANSWRPGFIKSIDNSPGDFLGGLAFCTNGFGSSEKWGEHEVFRIVHNNLAIHTTDPKAGVQFGDRTAVYDNANHFTIQHNSYWDGTQSVRYVTGGGGGIDMESQIGAGNGLTLFTFPVGSAGSTVATVHTVFMNQDGNVGMNTLSPQALLHVQDGAVLFAGETGITPVSGDGVRLMWIPARRAFRAGEVTGNQWNNSNIGDYSFAFGLDAQASGQYSTAIGVDAIASAYYAYALGSEASASADASYALGTGAEASELASYALGSSAEASGTASYALGSGAEASGFGSYALGLGAEASGTTSYALGYHAEASGSSSYALGYNATASGKDAFVLGAFATASGSSSYALGDGTVADNDYSFAIGQGIANSRASSLVVGFTTATLFVDNGHVGINTTTTAGYSFYVNGNAYCTTSWSTSDERFKTDIQPLGKVGDKLMKLRGVSYHWKQQEFPERKFSSDKQVGFVAQELEKVFPEVVHTGEDGYKAVAYQNLIPVIVEAFKEQHTTIEELKTSNDKLTTENEQIKSQMQMLIKRMDQIEESMLQCCEHNSLDRKNTSSTPSGIQDIMLEQNIPNPFNGTTVISYAIPSNIQGSIELIVSDISGSKILQHIPVKGAGIGNISISAKEMETGVYLYGIAVNGQIVKSNKMVIIK